MSDLHAILLGFLQGFSEWLPISSTAHVAVALHLFGLSENQGMGAAFTAVSQLGSVLAAVVYFRKDILDVLTRPADPRGDPDRADRRMLWPVIVGTLPVVVIGIALKDVIEGPFRALHVIAGSMVSFGIILAVVEKRAPLRRRLDSIGVMDGLMIGIGQAFSLMPGASRSGTTITAALACGFERATAARFSFLLSLPAITGAGLYEMVKHRDAIAAAQMARPMALAAVVAFVVGWATIDLLMKFLRRHPTYVFVWYRVIVGGIILALVAAGVLRG
jgi:undecaprenyl-diphosphatase